MNFGVVLSCREDVGSEEAASRFASDCIFSDFTLGLDGHLVLSVLISVMKVLQTCVEVN